MSSRIDAQVIKYYDNKESHGMIIDWSKVFREYNKLKVPDEYYNPTTAPVDKAKYIVEVSERASGKTTDWLLVGMILNRMYGTVIQYIRSTDDMIKPSIANEIYNVILSYEGGRYIKEITNLKYNSIYTHWKKSYFCHIDEEGKMDACEEKPFLQFLSIDNNFDYKSTYNAPTGDLILFDEFIGPFYRQNEWVDFCDLVSTIRRNRITPIIVMLANGIDANNAYFKELEINTEIRKMKTGEHKLITTELGTKIYFEIIGVKRTSIKEKINSLFLGFKNPKLASITGGEQAFAFENVPHILNADTDKYIDRRLRMDVNDVMLQLELVYTEDRGYVVNVHECSTIYDDSVILTNEEIWDRQHIWGIGTSKYLKYIWKLYKENKFYYDTNATGSLVKSYINTYLQNRR